MSRASKDEGQTVDIVFTYLSNSCRPYSVNEVHNNLQKEFSLAKPAVQRALDSMVLEGSLREKTYGKQKIYFVDQSKTTPVTSQEAAQVDEELAQLTQECQQLTEEVRLLESKASGVSKQKSLQQLKQEKESLLKECEHLETRVASLKQASGGVDPVENRKVRDKRTRRVLEWRKRKRLATSSLDAILEFYVKPKKALMEEMGIETDEDYDAVLPPL